MKKYQWDADQYFQFSSAQQKWARESINKAKIKSDEHVLDVGCGDGKVTVEIAELVTEGKVLGVDNSEAMINLAKEKFPHSKYPNLYFKVLDAKELNFNEEFDVIVSNAALHWVDDHIKVLKGMYNSLKNGGRIILQMGAKGNVPEAFFAVDKVIRRTEWSGYFINLKFPYYFFDIQEYHNFISQTEFRDIEIEIVEKDMQHKGKENLKGWIRTTWLPYTQRILEFKREEFIEEACTEFAQNFPADKNDVYHATAKRLIVSAKK
ncbi:MAG: methyltransferase domain-containing protein [Ignavibacterium sp.]|nr:methyltransferase domain-containing protein [Ignavibacterium sp.]